MPRPTGFEAIPGHGVRAIVEGQRVLRGRADPAAAARASTPAAAVREAAERAAARGQASIYLARRRRAAVAAFAVADAVRPESREAVQRLHDAASRW